MARKKRKRFFAEKRWLVVLGVIALASGVSLVLNSSIFADSSGPRLPVSDGAYAQWTPKTGTAHYTMVDEAACNGTTDYVSTNTVGHRDSFGISLSSIPNGAVISQIDITPCASKNNNGGNNSTLKVFYRFGGVNSADAGNYSVTGTTPVDLTATSFPGLNLAKTGASTLEVGALYASGSKGLRLSRIVTTVTFALPPEPVDLAQSLAPHGADANGQTAVTFANGKYTFTYSEGGNTVRQYEVDTSNQYVQKGLLRVRDVQTNSYPIAFAGTKYRKADGSLLQAFNLQQVTTATFSHTLWPSDIVSLSYTDTLEGVTTNKRFDLELRGKTLVIRAVTPSPRTEATNNYAGFNFDRTDQNENPQEVVIPYMETMPVVTAGTAGNKYFLTRYVDYTRSSANTAIQKTGPVLYSPTSIRSSFETQMVPGQNGVYPVFEETVYVTVSDTLEDVMPLVHESPSAYRDDLNSRVVFDSWTAFSPTGATRFQRAEQTIKDLNHFGMDNLWVIFHQWQNGAYDCGLPQHYPANPAWGGSADLTALINTAKGFGYLFGLHQNYLNFYPNSSYWESGQGNLALKADGTFVPGWNNPVCSTPQSYNIAVDKMDDYSDLESPSIAQDYAPNSSYLDITTSQALSSFVDHSAANPNARTFKDAFAAVKALNLNQKSYAPGPLAGEGRQTIGATDTWQAGSVEAVERQIIGGQCAPVIPDYELKYVKPLQANQGMGYNGRWLDCGSGNAIKLRPDEFPFDKYRATQIAFGHTGFMGNASFDSVGVPINEYYRYWVKEYYTFRDFQSQYLASDVTSILYKNSAGDMVDLAGAYEADVDFTNAQLKITYANGLTILINRSQTEVWNVELDGTTYYLPSNGWVASNPSLNFLEYSALVDSSSNPSVTGTRADYVRSGNYIMADPRGAEITFGTDFESNPLTTSTLKVVKPGGWSLTVQPDGSIVVLP